MKETTNQKETFEVLQSDEELHEDIHSFTKISNGTTFSNDEIEDMVLKGNTERNINSKGEIELNYDDLLMFDKVAGGWLMESKDNEDSTLGYAIRKVGDQIQRIVKKERKSIDLKLKEAEIESFATDDKGYIVTDDKGVKKQTHKSLINYEKIKQELIDEFEEYVSKKTYVIKPYFASKYPNLSEYQKEVFSKIVI